MNYVEGVPDARWQVKTQSAELPLQLGAQALFQETPSSWGLGHGNISSLTNQEEGLSFGFLQVGQERATWQAACRQSIVIVLAVQ